jgi:YidC/Oxa1 family membrane protein insertase
MSLNFLYTAVSWVLLRWHALFTAAGMDTGSGLTWALSIVALVVTARALLFRSFLKQVHFQRRMSQLQPKLAAIKTRYQGDRAEQQRQLLALHQQEGINPAAGFLPMLWQIPVFLGLLQVLRHLANSVGIAEHLNTATRGQLHKLTLYGFSQADTISAAKARLFGAPLAASFRTSASHIHSLGGTITSTHVVIVALLLISAGATLATQLLVRANATTTPTGTAATITRLMTWGAPLSVLISGLVFNFPLGVLLYWFTSNLWTLAQQAYVSKFHPPTPPPRGSSGTSSRSARSRAAATVRARSGTRQRGMRSAPRRASRPR